MKLRKIRARIKRVLANEIIRGIRTGLQCVPFGSALDVQIFDRIAEKDQERFAAFVRELAEEVCALAERDLKAIKKEFFDTDEFRFILREVLARAAREHRQEKIEAFMAILLNSMMTDTRIEFDRKTFFLEVVDAMTTEHLRLLKHLYWKRKEGKGEGMEPVGNIWKAFNAEDESTRNYLYSGLDSLASKMLILNSFIPLRKTTPTKMNKRGRKRRGSNLEYRTIDRSIQSFAITDLGIEFIEFITSPASRTQG